MGMLMCFQRLVELQESTRILMDLSATGHNPNHTYAELKVQSPCDHDFMSPLTNQTLTIRQIQLAASSQNVTIPRKSACCQQQTTDSASQGFKEVTRHENPQDILETWRLRTPNEWEPLTVWSDVLTWRNAIYNVVINAFKHMGDIAPHLHQLGYKDKAWCDSTCLFRLYLNRSSFCFFVCACQLYGLLPAGTESGV